MNVVIEQYEAIKRAINDISSTLTNADNISALDVTDDIRIIVGTFNNMLSDNRSGLSGYEISEIDRISDEIKEKIIKLKNQQIYAYNLKVWEVNDKISSIRKTSLDLGIGGKTVELKLLKWSKDYLVNDWKRMSYSHTLKYSELEETYTMLLEIEKDLQLSAPNKEPVDLNIQISVCKEILEDIKNEIKDDMTLTEINRLLNKCKFAFARIVDVDILTRKYIHDSSVSDKSIRNYKITDLYFNLTILKKGLLKKKSKVEAKSNDFTSLRDRLEVLNNEIKAFQEIISNYYGKCDEVILNRLKTILRDKLRVELSIIIKLKSEAKLESSQEKKLDLEIKKNKALLHDIKLKLKDPDMLEVILRISLDDMIIQLEKDLEDLRKDVEKLEKPLKDEGRREYMNSIIEERRLNIGKIEECILKEGLINDTDLRNKLNNIKNNFNSICREYNKKCPLFVKKVKPADKLYQKYDKDSLKVSGLASMAVLERSPVIPAIMRGNIVLGKKIPILNKFTNSINTILGSVINAKRDEKGEWYLSNGFKIDEAVAGTSLFQSLVASGFGTKPLIKKVRNFVQKMGLKVSSSGRTLKDKYQSLRNKFSNDYIDYMKLIHEENKLVNDFLSSGDDLDTYCERNGLTEEERNLIEVLASYKSRGGR